MKYILILIIIGYCIPIQAQLITNDKNWNPTPVFNDNFNPTRTPWDTNWFDYPDDNKWRAHLVDAGVTHGSDEHQVYQRGNAIFNSADSTIRLRAEYVGGPLICGDIINYQIPPSYGCDTSLHKLVYHSGAITNLLTFKYGYFEARCIIPVDTGSFPAFWLFNKRASPSRYEELDIFEYAWPDNSRQFSGGIWTGISGPEHRIDAHYYQIPGTDPDITNWHTYGLEWSPKRAIWYFDNKVIGEVYSDSVPDFDLNLTFNYAINDFAFPLGTPTPLAFNFPLDFKIDYFKVNKLYCDCNKLDTIHNNTELTNYSYAVKKKLTVGGFGSAIAIPASTKVTFRATDEITISGDFEVPLGSELELITHPCPE